MSEMKFLFRLQQKLYSFIPVVDVEKIFCAGDFLTNLFRSDLKTFPRISRIDIKLINTLDVRVIHNYFTNINKVQKMNSGSAEEVLEYNLRVLWVCSSNLSEVHFHISIVFKCTRQGCSVTVLNNQL